MPSHQVAIDMLSACNTVEIRYNSDLHAKVYVCIARTSQFALFGSGNLTDTSITRRIEVGMMIEAKGQGVPLVRELHSWANVRLRTQSDLIKKIEMRGN